MKVAGELKIPIPSIDIAFKVEGDAMKGVIDSGNIIGLKSIKGVHEICNGAIYLLVTETEHYLRYAYINDVGLILDSKNRAFEPIIIDVKSVIKIYEVVWIGE